VFMSGEETFGLVVAEAMSAGIPCVLSSLPVFRKFFGDCPGVVLIDDTNRSQAPAIVDDLLSRGASLKAPIQEFWEQRFSPEAVSRQWEELLTRVTAAPR
jgi:glycosyltransferase involved in cell wall biosynthesis